jgi:hypothetical protein
MFIIQTTGCMAWSVLKNALAYFATAVSYMCKMFMKLTPELQHSGNDLGVLDLLASAVCQNLI